MFLVYNVALLLDVGGGSDELSFLSTSLLARVMVGNQPSRLISSTREPSDAPNRLHNEVTSSVRLPLLHARKRGWLVYRTDWGLFRFAKTDSVRSRSGASSDEEDAVPSTGAAAGAAADVDDADG